MKCLKFIMQYVNKICRFCNKIIIVINTCTTSQIE